MQDAAAESSEAIPPEAILMASSKGFSDVVDALLDSGADIEAREAALQQREEADQQRKGRAANQLL